MNSKIITAFFGSLLWCSAALAQAPNTTQPGIGMILSPCGANVPVVGNGASVLTKCYASALPSALGTGISAAIGINVGTAGSVVVNGGALGTPFSGVATNLTGTAAGLTAGNVTTNANLTGDVTSVGNATTIGANKVTRAMEAQGVARSVVGVTGNATANVADIQGTASQFFGVNAGGTALAFQTMSGDCTLAGPAITCTKTNGTSFATVATSGSASDLGTGTLPTARLSLGQIVNSLGGDVAMNVSANYFDGPSTAQGSTGTWFASGTVTITDSAIDNVFCKLWDGTTVISSAASSVFSAGNYISVSLSGFLATPVNNLRISCRSPSTTTAVIKFNLSGNSKDSNLTVFRIN